MRKRDYAAEYSRRIDRALKLGFTRSQARGHAKPTELPISVASKIDLSDPRNTLIRRVIESGDPANLKLYRQAEREGWKSRKDPNEAPTAKDELLGRLSSGSDGADFSAGESLGTSVDAGDAIDDGSEADGWED